jgi:hypothetical protein
MNFLSLQHFVNFLNQHRYLFIPRGYLTYQADWWGCGHVRCHTALTSQQVDWGLDLASGEQSGDGYADLGFPEMNG